MHNFLGGGGGYESIFLLNKDGSVLMHQGKKVDLNSEKGCQGHWLIDSLMMP